MNTETPLVDAAVNDTALEDKNQPHTDWITTDAGREIEKRLNEAVEKNADLEKKLAKWESELSSVMPPDFKDWHQNSRDEWPEVARGVIKSLREREEFAFSCLNEERNALLASRAREAQLRTALEWIANDPHDAQRRAEDAITIPAPPVVPADQHEKLINDFSTACEIIHLVKRAVSDLPPHIEDCIDSFVEERDPKFPEVVPAEDVKPLVDALRASDHLLAVEQDDWHAKAEKQSEINEQALSTFAAKYKA